ncbi:glycosyl hydrolase [Pseudomaricurvus alkylphenolicus]|nr:glycosyl hydrolase [Pseudomaricurvus alkylphenolicus]
MPPGDAICYSGYRQGQSPQDGTYPSHEEIHQDLQLLSRGWKYLRLYDSGVHARRVLEVISKYRLDFKVMLGADIAAEVSNPNCPWGADYAEGQLLCNRAMNDVEIARMIELANQYPCNVFALSIGNEASVDWTDHKVPVERLIEFAQLVRKHTGQPVTFCENYVPWQGQLDALAAELDFISLHTYPVWEYRDITQAMDYTRENYNSVANRFPDKPVVITEAGWTTRSNGRGIEPWNANPKSQALYYLQLMDWSREANVLTFVFEAFDEPWKGSPDPDEPEKHWGLFTVDREPKEALAHLYAPGCAEL